MPSVKELWRVSQGKGKEHEKYLPFNTYVMRPLSAPVSWVMLKLNMTPNQVSALSFVFILASAASYLYATESSFIWGGILLYVWMLLDFVDGTLARYREKKTGYLSKYGGFVDSLGTDFINLFVWPAIGFGLFKNPTLGYTPEWTVGLVSPTFFLVLGFLMTSITLGQRVILAKYVGLAGEKSVKGRWERLKDKDWRVIIQLNVTGCNIYLAALLASIFGFLNWFLLFYVFAYIVEYLIISFHVILNVKREQAKEMERFFSS